jgi:hypothetical protein
MTTNKVLQAIRTQPLLFAVIAMIISAMVVFAVSKNQPRKRPVYQWERDSDALKKQIDQFSDLAQPSKKP